MANNSGRHARYNETEILSFFEELVKINKFWSGLEAVYKPVEQVIYTIGLAGNFLALITLWRSKKMRTPSFSYHRALVATDFLYCLNFFANLMATRFLNAPCRENVYRYWTGAFFTGTLNPALSSLCTYVLHYVTTMIALDRVLALSFPTGYYKWNRPLVARLVVFLAVIMSATVHSWSAFVVMEVIKYRRGEFKDGQRHQLLISNPCWNDSVVYYSLKKDNLTNTTLGEALKTKDIYNGAARMTYSIILTLLTLAVIGGLIRRRKRREAGRSTVSLASIASENSVYDRKRKGSDESCTSKYGELIKKRKNRGCERMLFVLMIAVLLLAFFQVAASETSRIFQFLYPPEIEGLLKLLSDNTTSIKEKLSHVRIAMYGHFYSRIFANAFTAIERSFVCLLYMAMNALFRRELLAMLKMLCFRSPCIFCKRKLRISTRQTTVQETGRTLVAQQESTRMVVADVEPVSGCHFRSVALSQSSGRML